MRPDLAPYPIALVLAAGLAFAVFGRPAPTTKHEAWRPPPAMRADLLLDRATQPVLVIARLREIRADLERISGDDPGPLGAVDRKLRDLISDLDLATKTGESRP